MIITVDQSYKLMGMHRMQYKNALNETEEEIVRKWYVYELV